MDDEMFLFIANDILEDEEQEKKDPETIAGLSTFASKQREGSLLRKAIVAVMTLCVSPKNPSAGLIKSNIRKWLSRIYGENLFNKGDDQ